MGKEQDVRGGPGALERGRFLSSVTGFTTSVYLLCQLENKDEVERFRVV